MGRSHPVGIILAGLLFGALYQGGSELAFDMPAVNRDMVVVIQARAAAESLAAPLEGVDRGLHESGRL
jgi:ABC-type uncharacterized transport system permease subunit